MKSKLVVLIAAFFTICLGASAQKHHPRMRMANGIKTGQITTLEANKIREERMEVKEEVKEARADGIVTDAERKKIKEERKEANQAIIRSRNNNRIRH